MISYPGACGATPDRLGAGETIADDTPLAEGPGDVIGNYKLLQQIGLGGFGVVYMAEQLRPVKRRVALKIIKLGMDTRQVVARFEVERQALAMMDHPNIAKVLDAGSTESGRPFFVMELVRGIPITNFCDEQNLSTEERLMLFVDVCHAVQHAHQKGIIHRDLKPSNVMVTLHDDKAVPKVIDFGVAKATQTDLTDKTLYTRYEQFIGTPAYMSPEQAQMSGLDIDTRSDIYALGVLLYELLTGRTPFDSGELLRASHDEIRRVIREDDPPKPSTRVNTLEDQELTDLAKHRKSAPERLHSLLRGDLDWIIMMALEKDRTRRYDTATGLALDIQRHLADEPVTAAAPSTSYRLGKYVRRNKRPLITATAIGSLVVIAGGSLIWQRIESNRNAVDAQRARDELLVLEAERTASELRNEQRKSIRTAVANAEWEETRDYVEEFFRNPSPHESDGAHSMDGIKLAAVCLRMEDRESFDSHCARLVEQFLESGSNYDLERTVRAYFYVPRSPEDPQAQKVREIARQNVNPLSGWSNLGQGMAEYRMGNYSGARELLSASTKIGSIKVQVTAQPFLAMTAHQEGDSAKANSHLQKAKAFLTGLESDDVSYFWHERLLGRLALEEARKLIAGE